MTCLTFVTEMEELRDASIHHTAQKLAVAIKAMKNYDEIFKKVQVHENKVYILLN